MTERQPAAPAPAEALRVRVDRAIEISRPFVVHLWRDRGRLIWANAAIISVALVLLLFVIPPFYRSSIVILPDRATGNAGMLSQLSGLASLSGLGNLSVGRGVAPEIYENLLYSESILHPVFKTKYRTQKFTEPVDLVEYFEVERDQDLPDDLADRQQLIDLAELFVPDKMSVDIDRISSVITVTIQMPESRLSADVVNALATSLDRYVVEQNQKVARETMRYIESRLEEGADSLADAEEDLRRFHEQNRSISTSPTLMLEQARLMRVVEHRQALYTEMLRQHEIARIDYLKETPIVNFREEAEDPIEKAGPRRTRIMLLVILVSALLTSTWSLAGLSVKGLQRSAVGR